MYARGENKCMRKKKRMFIILIMIMLLVCSNTAMASSLERQNSSFESKNVSKTGSEKVLKPSAKTGDDMITCAALGIAGASLILIVFVLRKKKKESDNFKW